MKEPISQANDNPTKWLITGGCGFIGTSLIKNLVSEGGHHIRVLDNLSVGTREDLARVCEFSEISLNSSGTYTQSSALSTQSLDVSPQSSSGTEVSQPPACPVKPSLHLFNRGAQSLNNHPSIVALIIGDITDYDTCLNASKNIDVIVHLAANTGVGPSVEDPRKDMESNVIGTFNMLEAARQNGVKRFVFASSGAPVGECDPPIHEGLAPHPVSPYGASKLAGEGYCSSYFRTFGIETIALRFGNVYGPGSGHKNSVIAKFIKLAMNGEVLEIYGDGNQTRDFIFIDDLINAIRKAASIQNSTQPSACPVKPFLHLFNRGPQCPSETETSQSSALSPQSSNLFGEVFQIATSKETTLIELVDILKPILKKSGISEIKVIHGEKRLGDVIRNYSDTSKALNTLGWQCTHDLSNGIEKTVKWFVSSR